MRRVLSSVNKNVFYVCLYQCLDKYYLVTRINIHVWIFQWCSFNMSCYLTGELFTVIFILLINSITLARILDPVNWNSSNPMFKVSNVVPEIEVNMYDQIDFVCPHYPAGTGGDSAEYYLIYAVPKSSYDNCKVDTDRLLIVNCSRPAETFRFRVDITGFSPVPGVPEFRHGEKRYFITTSTGTEHGINNHYQGACYHNNMKLSIKVCCDSTTTSNVSTTPPPAQNTPSTPSRLKPSTHPSTTTVSTTTGDVPSVGDRSSTLLRSIVTASTTTRRPTRPTTTTTTAAPTTTTRWRSTARTNKPAGRPSSTTKSSGKDIDNGENDTVPKTKPQTSSSISLRTTNSWLHIVLFINCIAVLVFTKR